jgi:hypothetical protein
VNAEGERPAREREHAAWKTPKTTTTPDAKSGENGGTKVTVAGAVAINVIDSALARIDRRRRRGDVDRRW